MLDDLTPFTAAVAPDDRYLLLWCHTGTVTVHCGVTERLTAGQGVLVPPGRDVTLVVTPGAVAVPVRIDVGDVPEGADEPQVFTPGEGWNDWLLHHFTASIAPVREPGYRPAEIVECLRGSAGPVTAPPMPRSPAARQVSRALVRDPASDRTVVQWAESVRVGERTLHRAFAAETGRTFAAWRRELRVDVARARLREPGVSVAQVAEEVGFRTVAGFTRAFRELVGQTPTAWRAGQGIRGVATVPEARGTRSSGLPSVPPTWAAASSPPSLDHGFHLLLWVWRGMMQLTVGGRDLAVGEGEAAWMPAYRGHGVHLDPGSVVLPLTFTVGEVEPGDDLGPVPVPEYEAPVLLRHVMANQCGVAPPGYDRTVVPAQDWVPGRVVASTAAPAADRASTAVPGVWSSAEAATVADALLGNLRDRRTLSQWAVCAGMSPRQLNAQFREATGMTLLQWRTTVRLQTARRLLAAGTTPSESAHAVGYRHLSQFSRDFSARYGTGPREFVGV